MPLKHVILGEAFILPLVIHSFVRILQSREAPRRRVARAGERGQGWRARSIFQPSGRRLLRVHIADGFATFAGGVAPSWALDDGLDAIAVVAAVAAGLGTAKWFDWVAGAAVVFAVGGFTSFEGGAAVGDQTAAADKFFVVVAVGGVGAAFVFFEEGKFVVASVATVVIHPFVGVVWPALRWALHHEGLVRLSLAWAIWWILDDEGCI